MQQTYTTDLKKILPYVTGSLMAVIFGFSFLFSKNALDSISVMQLLFLRFLLAFGVMSLFIALRIIRIDLKGKDIRPVLMVSFWQPFVYFIMENSGLKYTSASGAGVMIATIPIVSAILSAVILKEKANKLQLGFILISIAGVVVMVFGEGSGGGESQMVGVLLLLGAVFSASMYNIFSRKASTRFTTVEITYIMMIVGTVVFGVLFAGECVLSGGTANFSIGMPAVIAVLYLGVVSSVIAFLLWNYTLSKLPAAQTAVFANLTTVVSVIAGVTFRNEQFGFLKLIGTVTIIAGVVGTNYFTNERFSKSRGTSKEEVI